MKTPRELVIQQHQKLEPEFDAMRARILREVSQIKPVPCKSAPPISNWFVLAWRELILPSRVFWKCSAVAFAALVLVNVALEVSGRGAVTVRSQGALAQETGEILRAQYRLRAELLGEIRPVPMDESTPEGPVKRQSLRQRQSSNC